MRQQGDGSIKNKAIMKKLAEYYFRCGKDRKAVAKELGVSAAVLCRLMGGKTAVEEAELSRQMTDCEVENALFKKACGYTYTEVKETEKANGTEVTTLRKEAAPDVSAAKAWLEYRCPEMWGAKAEKNSSEEKLDAILDVLDKDMGK